MTQRVKYSLLFCDVGLYVADDAIDGLVTSQRTFVHVLLFFGLSCKIDCEQSSALVWVSVDVEGYTSLCSEEVCFDSMTTDSRHQNTYLQKITLVRI